MSKVTNELLKYFFTNPLIITILLVGLISAIFYKQIVGWFGEYWTKKALNKLSKDNYKIINNLFISVNGITHQIDHVIISQYGIFSIETKQYNGYITGNKYDKNWVRHAGKNKYYYINPIRQNYGHCKALSDLLNMDESKIKPGDNLFEVSFKYEDINDQITKTVMSNYKYEIKDLNFAKANEEYIRSYVYDVLEEAIKLRESYKYEEGKKILKDLKDWIKANYKGDNKDYLNDIEKSEKMFDMNDINSNRNFIFANCQVRQMQNKRMGSNNMYMNNCQAILQNNYQMNFAMSQQAAPSPYNMNFGNQSHGIPNAMPMMNNIQAPLMQNNMQAQQMQNNIQAPPIFQQMPMSQFNPMNPLVQQMPPNSQNLNPMNKNH